MIEKPEEKGLLYTVFSTDWGYFGLLGTEKGILRSHLPDQSRRRVTGQLLADRPSSMYRRQLFGDVQEMIVNYFKGKCVDFSEDIPLILDGLSNFARTVFSSCRQVGYGQAVSYARLARMAGFPNCPRAVGRVLAVNPLPLIVPCHRVILSSGRIGGFSAAGGDMCLKKRLLLLEGKNIPII